MSRIKNNLCSSFTLKAIAIGCMTTNHIANVLTPLLPFWLLIPFYAAGGIAFPLFAFLLVEGFHYTHNVKRYLGRLVIFAAIAQIPYSLLWGATGNVLLTLAAGLLALMALHHFKSVVRFIIPLALIFVSYPWDYGGKGVILILLLESYYCCPVKWKTLLLSGIAVIWLGLMLGPNLSLLPVLDPQSGITLVTEPYRLTQLGNQMAQTSTIITAVIAYDCCSIGSYGLMYSYNYQQGPRLKWFFYIYYPLHLMILWLIAITLGL